VHTGKVRFESCSDPWIQPKDIKALTDGTTQTACQIKVQRDLPTDLVYSFGNEVVSAEKIEVQLNVEKDSDKIVGQVEIMASLISPQVGFQLLREDTLRATKFPQTFSFPAAGAKWILIRFKTPVATNTLAVSEINLWGYPGPPQVHYAFKETPATALQVLAKLTSVSRDFAVNPEEADLFQDTRDGKLDRWSFDDAVLLASGVRTPAARSMYLAKLNQLEQDARKMLDALKDPMQKGAKLHAWLHARILRDYQFDQIDLTTLLDQQTFNCVSATALYTLLGRRLGLDIRTVEAPDHVFSILYNGLAHADVETTNPQGFNPTRDPEIIKQFSAATGFVYIPEEHKDKRREIRDLGLLSIIYCVRGARLAKQHNCPEALRAFFCALTLDSEIYSAIHNVLSTLSGWSVILALDNHFPEAIKVAQTGLEIAPRDENLNYTHKIICFQWADAALDKSDTQTALAIFKQAAKAAPESGLDRLEAWAFVRPGTALVDQGNLQQALNLAESAKGQVSAPAQTELEKWRTAVYTAWYQSELEKLQYAKAVDILEQAIKAMPKEKRFQYYLGYVVQIWAESAWQKNDLRSAGKILAGMLKRHPRIPEIKMATIRFSGRILERSLEAVIKTEVMFPLETLHTFLADQGFIHASICDFYTLLAERHVNHQEWKQGAEIYQRALKIFPADEQLQNNAAALWESWMSLYLQAGHLEEALAIGDQAALQGLDNAYFQEKLGDLVAVYAKQLLEEQGSVQAEAWLGKMVKKYPHNPYIAEAVEQYLQNRLEEIKNDPRFMDKSLEITRRCQSLLVDDGVPQKLTLLQYDNLAEKYLQDKKWENALRIYKSALKFYPNDLHVRNNIMVIWDAWQTDCIRAGDWDKALKICDLASQQYLDKKHYENLFKDTIKDYIRTSYSEGGLYKSGMLLADLLKQFPFKPVIREMAVDHFQSLLEALNSGNLDTSETMGLEIIKAAEKTLHDPQITDDLNKQLYTRLATEAENNGNREAAIRFYAAALKKAQRDTQRKSPKPVHPRKPN
jgi:tetratricopeptide (TPR) repeat protein